MTKLYIVVPCYNEEDVIQETIKQLSRKMNQLISKELIDDSSKLVFVDDGSKDKTWELLTLESSKNNTIISIKLAHNRGHQNALLAGLNYSKDFADAVISMDADLQDDIDTIDDMVSKFHDGFEIVFGVRNDRSSDTWFKRSTALFFYRLMSFLGTNIIENHADFRLMSKTALIKLSEYKEVNVFLRGLVRDIGLKSTESYYSRHERFAGESKYPLKKMLAFALNGITSFSVKPLRLISLLGTSIFVMSLGIMVYSLVRFISGQTVTGWTFLNISIWFFAGVQMLSLGVLGEYIGKIYIETKHRPLFSIERIINDQNLK